MDNNTASQSGSMHIVDTTVISIVIGLNALTSILGCVTNLIIFITIIKSKALRTAMNMTLVNLALVDFFNCAVNIPVRIILYSGISSHELCSADLFFQTLCDCVQPFMLAATSFERYQSIAKPFENQRKFKRTVFTVCMSWIVAVGVGIASALFTVDGATTFPCCIQDFQFIAKGKPYRELVVMLPIGLTCLLLVTSFYCLMMRTLNKHGKNMVRKPRPFKNKINPKDNKIETPGFSLNKNDSAKGPPDQKTTNISKQSRKSKQYTEMLDKDNLLHQISKECLPDSSACSSQSTPENVNLFQQNVKHPRFTIRQTRKSIIRIMKEQNLIGRKEKHIDVHLSNMEYENTAQVESVEEKLSFSKISNYADLPKIFVTNTFQTEAYNDSTVSVCNSLSVVDEDMPMGKDSNLQHIDRSSELTFPTFNSNNEKTDSLGVTNMKDNEIKTDAEKQQNHLNESVNGVALKTMSSNKRLSVDLLGSGQTKRLLTVNTLEIPAQNNHDKTNANTDYLNPAKHNTASATKTFIDNENEVVIKLAKHCHDDIELESVKSHPNAQQNVINTMALANTLKLDTPICEEIQTKCDNEDADNKEQTNTETARLSLLKGKSQKTRKVDVVEMDGTVHKRVEVDGSVTGAVCVLNPSNKILGRRKVEMRAAKRIAVLIGSFVLLWLPLPLAAMSAANQTEMTSATVEILMVMGAISGMTTAVNPLLNLLLNKQLRSAATNNLKRWFILFK